MEYKKFVDDRENPPKPVIVPIEQRIKEIEMKEKNALGMFKYFSMLDIICSFPIYILGGFYVLSIYIIEENGSEHFTVIVHCLKRLKLPTEAAQNSWDCRMMCHIA